MSLLANRAGGRVWGRQSWYQIVFAVLSVATPRMAVADGLADERKSDKPADRGVELVVDPAAEPVPALRYHLLPLRESLREGNAAPIYLRVTYERSDEGRRQIYEEPDRFLDMPRDELPLGEVGRFLENFSDVTEQFTAAAYRSDCNWEYVTEDRDPLSILLPDAQAMRSFGKLLALKARYEIQSGKLPAAAGTLQDGLALCRHVAQAPFLVNQLIGAAISGLMFSEVEAFIAQPGAVNLYWALATLPRPFISYDRGLATERQFLRMRFPELRDLDRPRSEEQWQSLLVALRDWGAEVQATERRLPHQPATKSTAEQIQQARAYLMEDVQLPAKKVKAMSDAEVEVRYAVALYDEIVEDWEKWFYVPYSQSLSRLPQLFETLRKDADRRELFPLATAIVPTGGNGFAVLKAQARTQRMVARLQAIEALRMHAAATGHLPVTLDEVTIVPVPDDPATGAPFRYTREKAGAILDVADELGMSREALRMPVRIRLRGK